jgi:hypothetical protein
LGKEIPIQMQSDPSAGTHPCSGKSGSADLTDLQFELYQQLSYMRRISFSRALPWTSKTLYDWFRDSIRGITIQSGGGFANADPVTKIIRIPLPPDYHVPHLTLERLNPEGLIHEARHTEPPNGFPHTCSSAKDNTIAEMGAFGIQYYFDLWMAESSSESSEVKRYFAGRAWELRASAFCRECTASPADWDGLGPTSTTLFTLVSRPTASSAGRVATMLR